MYRYEGINLLFTVLGLMAVFYLIVVFSPVMVVFLIAAVLGYGVYLLIQQARARGAFRKSSEKFDEKGRKITEATVLEITDDDEPVTKK